MVHGQTFVRGPLSDIFLMSFGAPRMVHGQTLVRGPHSDIFLMPFGGPRMVRGQSVVPHGQSHIPYRQSVVRHGHLYDVPRMVCGPNLVCRPHTDIFLMSFGGTRMVRGQSMVPHRQSLVLYGQRHVPYGHLDDVPRIVCGKTFVCGPHTDIFLMYFGAPRMVRGQF